MQGQKNKSNKWKIIAAIAIAVFVLVIILIIGGTIAVTKLLPASLKAKRAEENYNTAVEYYNDGNYVSAVRYITDAYEVQPENEEYRKMYVDCYLAWGSEKEAMGTDGDYLVAVDTYKAGMYRYDDGRLKEAYDNAYAILQSRIDEDKTGDPSSESEEDSQTVSQVTENPPTSNNLSEVVEYDGAIYRRNYTIKNYQREALWAEFGYIPGTCTMTKINSDNTVTSLFEDKGCGDFFIYKGVMYSQYLLDNGMNCFYSCNVADGSDFTDIANGRIVSADETTGKIFYLSPERENDLYCFDCETKSAEYIDTMIDNVYTIADGNLFYAVFDSTEEFLYKVKRYSISEKTSYVLAELARTEVTYEYEADCMVLENLTVVDDQVYFAYGGYSGSGFFSDGCVIFRVGVNENKANRVIPDSSILAMPDYYVQKNTDGVEVYFTDSLGMTPMVVRADGVCEENTTGKKYTSQGSSFTDEKGNRVKYETSNGEQTLLVSASALNQTIYGDYDVENDEEYNGVINDYEIVDGKVFFTVMIGKHDPANDIGWRYSYKALEIKTYCYDQSTDQITVLE